MQLLTHPVFLEHDTGSHPENRLRLEAFGPLPVTEIADGERWLPLVHSAEHIERVRLACQGRFSLDPDTVTSPGSFAAAAAAVGATLQASEQGDFALVRPPGHHAYPDRATGFCLFNSIAVAVQRLVLRGKRVFILDFDGHLGDGTLHIFEHTHKVFFASVHQYPAFPGQGWVDDIGLGRGTGYSLNLPLPPGSGDDVFLDAVQLCGQALTQYRPEVVAVSAGFDAHLLDPLLQLAVTESTFFKIGQMLRNQPAPVFATLEGGYNTEVLPLCVAHFLAGINGEAQPPARSATVSEPAVQEEYLVRKRRVQSNLSQWWTFD